MMWLDPVEKLKNKRDEINKALRLQSNDYGFAVVDLLPVRSADEFRSFVESNADALTDMLNKFHKDEDELTKEIEESINKVVDLEELIEVATDDVEELEL